MSIEPMTIRVGIRAGMERKGWSQSELARRINVSRQYISTILDDEVPEPNWTLSHLREFANALDLNLTVFMSLRTAAPHVAEAPAGVEREIIVNDMGELRDALREALTLPKLYDNLRTITEDERRCERRRSHLDVTGDGAFGIAVASDEWALEWQKLHAEAKVIKERIDAIITRCAPLANASSDRPNDGQCAVMSQQPGKQL